jgi:hypothetical protein
VGAVTRAAPQVEGSAAILPDDPAASDPFSAAALAAVRRLPTFRAAAEQLARDNLANYAALSLAERWLISDLGRAALTGALLVLDAIYGGVSTAQLVQSALANRTCSEGRVRLYLRRAIANGFVAVDRDGIHRIAPPMEAVIARSLRASVSAVAQLDPALRPALAVVGTPQFRRRFAAQMGLCSAALAERFKEPDKPIGLFLGRDGGTRLLEQIIAAQRPGRDRLLESAPLSQRALAQHAFVSRTHVARLLAEGERLGLLRAEARRLVVSAVLSEDVERHYALMLQISRVSARAALEAG